MCSTYKVLEKRQIFVHCVSYSRLKELALVSSVHVELVLHRRILNPRKRLSLFNESRCFFARRRISVKANASLSHSTTLTHTRTTARSGKKRRKARKLECSGNISRNASGSACREIFSSPQTAFPFWKLQRVRAERIVETTLREKATLYAIFRLYTLHAAHVFKVLLVLCLSLALSPNASLAEVQ